MTTSSFRALIERADASAADAAKQATLLPRGGIRGSTMVLFDGELCRFDTLAGNERSMLEWMPMRRMWVGGYPI